MSLLDKFWIQLEKGQIIRRIAFFGTMWLTYKSYMWVFAYASAITNLTPEHSMLIAAILGPVSALQGAVIKFYAENEYKPNILLNIKENNDGKK